MNLSDEQVATYERDGYLFPLRVLADEEIAHFRSALEEAEARQEQRGMKKSFAQPHLHFGWAYDLVTHASLLAAVESLLGPDVLVHSSSVFSKPPHDEAYVAWHQDGHFWDMSSPRLVSAWVALSESSLENGCLEVIPGSHRTRVPHLRSRAQGSLLASGLTVDMEVDEAAAVPVPLLPGEMSLHHLNTIHGSRSNRSGIRRLGIAIRYAATEVRQTIEHHPVVLARGSDGHGFYDLLEGRPAGGVDAGLDAQAAFLERQRKVWIAQGRVDG